MKKEYTLEEQGKHNRDFVNLQVKNLITRLFKDNLNTMEDHERDPNPVKARKKILDSGNDTIREVYNLLDVFDFYINPAKLEAAQSRRTIKKLVVNAPYYVE